MSGTLQPDPQSRDLIDRAGVGQGELVPQFSRRQRAGKEVERFEMGFATTAASSAGA